MLANTSGFLYYVSVLGITGTKTPDIARVAREVARIRQATELPIAVGFGVKSEDQVRALAGECDAVVVGSALTRRIGETLDPHGLATAGTAPSLLELVSVLARGSPLPQDWRPPEEGSRDELDQEFRPPENPLLPRRQARAAGQYVGQVPETGEMVFYRDLEANQFVIPNSGHHMRMSPDVRLNVMFDGGEFEEITLPEVTQDPLRFRDERRYADRLKEARTKTERNDCVMAALGTLDGIETVITVQDFAFMGGSLGMAAGEAIITAMLTAVERRTPFVLFVSGRRPHAGRASSPHAAAAHDGRRPGAPPRRPALYRGADPSHHRRSDCLLRHARRRPPRRARCLIGFAGPRVIEQTIREKLPEGFRAPSICSSMA